MMAPKSFALDSDCLIAALSLGHPFHQDAASELGRRLAAGESLVVVSDTRVQAYSVLTRMPRPHRLSPRSAWMLIETVCGDAPVRGLSPAETEAVLTDAVSKGISGGAIYDYLIGSCAVRAGVSRLLTFNVRDFERFGLAVEIVRPRTAA